MKSFCSLFLGLALLCSAGPKTKLSPDLQVGVHGDAQQIQVIIQWNGTESASQRIIDLGGSVISEFRSVLGGTYLIPSTALEILSQDPAVKHISPDRKVRRKLATATATIGAPQLWKQGFVGTGVGVAILDSGVNADDDLGLKQHGPIYSEDFTVPEALNSKGKTASKAKSYGLDWYGHGQHIAGIIASNAKTSTCKECFSSFVGVAPGARLINLKVLDRNGQGDSSAVIAAIDRAIELKDTYNIRVINLSLGQPVAESYKEDPLCQAAEAAWKAGIVVVVAAGNEGRDDSFGNQGYGTITSPGNDPYVLTVGAMKSMNTPQRSDDLIASYSSKGPTAVDHIVKPDILAPGNQIISLRAEHSILPLEYGENIALLSTYQSGTPSASTAAQPTPPSDPTVEPPSAKIGRGYSPAYFTLSGTSMAAAVVSGAIADLLQAAPTLTPDQVKMLLMKTSSKNFPDSSTVVDAETGRNYVSYYDLFTVGAGYLDLSAALANVKQVPAQGAALSPAAAFDPITGSVELTFDLSSIFSERSVWGSGGVAADRSMWGSDSIWSSSVLMGNRALWGSRSMWGADTDTSAERSMWGSSALWGNRSMWGANAGARSETTLRFGEQ